MCAWGDAAGLSSDAPSIGEAAPSAINGPGLSSLTPPGKPAGSTGAGTHPAYPVDVTASRSRISGPKSVIWKALQDLLPSISEVEDDGPPDSPPKAVVIRKSFRPIIKLLGIDGLVTIDWSVARKIKSLTTIAKLLQCT